MKGSTMQKKRIFVYGTLKKGGALHWHLGDADYLGVDKLNGFIMFRTGWFPTVQKTDDLTKSIHGEVYMIDKRNYDNLDMVEGSLFKKELCDTIYGKASIYINSPFVKIRDWSAIPNGFFEVEIKIDD
jgi:gamma-glutamylcyclotransferase (GGCT)/AIG2-like uncharacterized protein YtfP